MPCPSSCPGVVGFPDGANRGVMKIRQGLCLLAAAWLAVGASAQTPGVEAFGTACGGGQGLPPMVGISSNLTVGGTTTLLARNMPSPAVGFLVQGWDRELWNAAPLPMSMGQFGMTGCDLLVRPDEVRWFVASGSWHQWQISVPPVAMLQGHDHFAQVFFRDLAANEVGMGTTRALRMRIDPPPTQTSYVSSITRHGISWVFDRPVQAGRFVNGDWFVLGPVHVVDMLPRPALEGSRVMHGAMLNPDPSTPDQGYDGRLYGNSFREYYKPSLNVSGVSQQAPLRLMPGDSLVKVESLPTVPNPPTPANLRTAAVLTVLDTAPPEGAFRPPYAGRDRAVAFHEGMIDYGKLLQLQPAAGVPLMADTAAKFERVWLDHSPNWLGRMMHPVENMPDYGRQLAAEYGEAALLAHCNFTQAEKRLLVIRLIQIGIDNYGCLTNGCFWPGLGGHGSGRKLPILFAGELLADGGMLGIGQTFVTRRFANGDSLNYFGEDSQTFLVAETAPGQINYGFGGYGAAQIGLADWGFSHNKTPQNDDSTWTGDPYRVCCTVNAWIGHVLVARMMGLVDEWNHAPLFDYTDRYLQREPHGWTRAWKPWTEAMWDRYRPSF
jgi:hypothetical protein